jgi:hypothetical protein
MYEMMATLNIDIVSIIIDINQMTLIDINDGY